MFNKIKKYQHSNAIKQVQDVRVLALLGFGLVAFMVSWSTITAIQTNYGLQKQIAQLEQENKIQKLKNENQKLTNQYYNTNEFLELAARQHFGKAAPGETVLIVPKSVALAHTTNIESASSKLEPAVRASQLQLNFEAWMNFFLHRQN